MSRLYGLDALRGVAALVVAYHHLGALYGLGETPFSAQLAVDLFFILSGFVMARTYEPRMHKGLTAGRFIALRYRRLFLPLAIGSTIGFVWAVLYNGFSLHILFAYGLILAFLPAWWLPIAFIINGPAWSLFLEILSNALHGALFGKLSSRMLVGLWLVCTAIFVVLELNGLEFGYRIENVLWLIPRALSCYLAGILICRTFGDKPLWSRPRLAIGVFVACLALALVGSGVEILIVVVAFPLIVRASLALEDAPWAGWAGALSYPLYATHVPVQFLSHYAGLHWLWAAAMCLAVATLVTVAFELRRDQRKADDIAGTTGAQRVSGAA